MPTTRSQSYAPLSCAGRKRKATEAVQSAKPAKKAKSSMSADETYLQQAIEEFSKQHRCCPKRSYRRETLESSLRYFRRFEMPRAKDAHSPSTEQEAWRLLARDKPIHRPVFVRDGANWSMIDRNDHRRPIEQLFDFLHDPSEEEEYQDESASSGARHKNMSVREIKSRFLSQQQQQDGSAPPRFPRNFPDLRNPMLDRGIPRFMQSAQCTLLHDIMRGQLGCEAKDVCDCGDDGDGEKERCGHRIRRDEYMVLQQIWRYWQGTVMLAEPGSVTLPHWDKYSTSTWIACIEGEIGFGWLADPTDEEKTSWLEDVSEPKGRWLFRVLRPGDVVYMPPGTMHFVFRRPGGGQTMGFASQMLRRADMLAWLQHLKIEMGYAVSDVIEDAPYAQIVPGTLNGLLRLVNHACREGEFEKFRGRSKIRKIIGLIDDIDDMVCQLPDSKKEAPAPY